MLFFILTIKFIQEKNFYNIFAMLVCNYHTTSLIYKYDFLKYFGFIVKSAEGSHK